jgi:DNA-binding SARP family transcriptional activator
MLVRPGSKVEGLIGHLALQSSGLARDELLDRLWPEVPSGLAIQSLNTLVYSLQRSLGEAIAGAHVVVHDGGRYRLNLGAGVAIDVIEFDQSIDAGERLGRAGDLEGQLAYFTAATAIYQGDLVFARDIRHVIERERLRARYVQARARIAEHWFAVGAYGRSLDDALALLAIDPCREDAHRLAMRSYVRLGQRAQAMRQYQLCRTALAAEFQAGLERATEELYEQVRSDPTAV